MAGTRLTLLLPLFLPNVEVTFRGWMGGAIYVQNLATVLSQLPAEERPRILVLTDGGLDAHLVRVLFNLAAVEGVFEPTGTPLAIKPALASEVLGIDATPDMTRINALLDSTTTIFPVLRSMFSPAKALHWIPDFQHRYLAELFDAEEVKQRDTEFRIMTHSRQFVLVSSVSARADLAKFYPTATAKTYVWHFASSLDSNTVSPVDPRPQFNLPPLYLFAPNQFWVHKGHRNLFRAIKLLRDRGIPAVVACTGRAVDKRLPHYMDELKAFICENSLEESVRLLGVVSQDLLVNLFRYSAAVIQPSLFEGWSTVVEDAKALGRPLILTDLPVHREQAEGSPIPFHFYEPGNAEALATVLAEVWPCLVPGPETAAEAAAQASRRLAAQASARAFIAIMHAMAQARSGNN